MLEKVLMVYSQEADTSSGIGAIPEGQTWYICSKGITNYISYMMRVVKTSEAVMVGFGINEVENHPKQYDKEIFYV
ncbi:hypothetical protein C1645_835353 [Glomus cerebriforme]|uniref:Uncharacterized protein n=1 Tax=Glomus cerebriforme TaxID=658196 RepID=A0A397S912_9GLOM|nr:hypothetical protein C1645_835353 [Glomus cerebriforme]